MTFYKGYRATFGSLQSDNRAPIGFVQSCNRFSIEARLTRLKPIGSRLFSPQSLNNPVQSGTICYNHAPILDCTFLPLNVARLYAFYNQILILYQSRVIVFYQQSFTNPYNQVPILYQLDPSKKKKKKKNIPTKHPIGLTIE